MRSTNGDWEEFRDDFCHSFSSLSRKASLRSDILAYEQLEKESIGSAWARVTHLLASSPDRSIPDNISLHIFYICLDMDPTDNLDIAAGGSFANKTSTEGRKNIDHILENFSFLTYHYKPQ